MILSKEQIDKVFRGAKEQADYVVKLYSLVVPNWGSVAKIDGYPECGEALSEYLWNKAVEWDADYKQKTGKRFLIGGLWMSYGFSCNNELKPWEVSLAKASITYKEISNGAA